MRACSALVATCIALCGLSNVRLPREVMLVQQGCMGHVLPSLARCGAYGVCLSRGGGTGSAGVLWSWTWGYGSHATYVGSVWQVAMLVVVTRAGKGGCGGADVRTRSTQDGWAWGAVDELVDLKDFVVWGLRQIRAERLCAL